jgi:hypothetical protein
MSDTPRETLAARELEALNRKLVDGIVKPLDLDRTLDAPEIVKSLAAGLAHETGRWLEIQNRYYRRHLELWAACSGSAPHAAGRPPADPDSADRRFRAEEWRKLPYFEYLAGSYLLSGQWLRELVETAKLEPRSKRKLEFFIR